MGKPFVPAVLAAGLLALALDTLFFQALLAGSIGAEPSLRPPLDIWPKLVFQSLLAGWAMVWLYSKGITSAPWLAQGIRFGLMVALLAHGAVGLLWAGMLNHEGEAAVVGIISLGMVRDLAVAVLIAFLYRNTAPSAQGA